MTSRLSQSHRDGGAAARRASGLHSFRPVPASGRTGANRCSSAAWPRRAASITAIRSSRRPASRERMRSTRKPSSCGGDFRRRRRACASSRSTRRSSPRRRSASSTSARIGSRITHLIITTCTGLSSPGLDLELIDRCGLPAVGRAHHPRLHGMLRRDQRPEARAPHRALRARGARARREPRALHAASQGDREPRGGADLPALGRRLRRLARHRRSARGVARQLQRRACAGHARPDDLERPRFRLRHAALGPGAERHPRRARRRTSARSSKARRSNRSTLWAVHPGGRSVLDAVEKALQLAPDGARRFARGAAPLRQHVVGDGHVRARRAFSAPRRPASRAAPCPSVRDSLPRRCCSIPSGSADEDESLAR